MVEEPLESLQASHRILLLEDLQMETKQAQVLNPNYPNHKKSPRLIAIMMGIGFVSMFINYKQQSCKHTFSHRFE